MKSALITMLLSFGVCFIAVWCAVPLLKRIKAGQPILKYVTEHQSKNGTPTMGGLGFILPALIVAIAFRSGSSKIFLFSITIGLAYLVVGFLDDFIKIRSRHNEGLRPYQKIVFQMAIALIGAGFAYKNGLDFLHIPFWGRTVFIGYGVFPLVAVVFLATTNSVNLTDGQDGLAGSVSFVYFLLMGIVLQLQMRSEDLVNGEELHNLTLLSFALAGGILAFLCFNFHKATLFMGDTGSMALGGLVGTVSLFSGNAFYIPVLGIMYVVSSISVIMQVAWFKLKKKRIFLMAPFHHHLQKKGLTEGKIAFSYATITFLMGIGLILSLL